MSECKYCRDDNKPLYHADGPIQRMDSFVWVADGQIEIDLWWASGNICVVIQISYCPMCGRKLGDAGRF